MSQGNIEMIRAALDAINHRDFDAAFKDAAPDFEYDASRAVGPQGGSYKLGEARHAFDEFMQPWESVRFEADEFIEAGEHMVTPVTTYHRGREGIEVQARASWVWTFRDGTVVRITLFQKRQDALEAVGLSE